LSTPTWEKDLVAQLTKLADPANIDRAVLAHLRRGLDRPPDYALGRVGWLFSRVPDWAVENAVLAAGLFAWVKGNCAHKRPKLEESSRQKDGPNFGDAFGKGPAEVKDQRQKRFIDLLDTDEAELPFKLRQAITLIEGQDLDWVLLVNHLNHWGHPDRWVQKQWARGFWSISASDAESVTDTATAE